MKSIVLTVLLSLLVAPAALATERPQQAVQRLAAAIKNQPTDMDARRNIADCFIKMGLAARACEQMRIVMQYGQRTPQDFILLGDAQRYSGKYTDAIRTYQEALNQSPGNAKALSGLAYAYMLSGDTTTATKICQSGFKQTDEAGKRTLSETLRTVESSRLQAAEDKNMSLALNRS